MAPGSPPYFAVDGTPATGFQTGAQMAGDEYIQIDFHGPITFAGMVGLSALGLVVFLGFGLMIAGQARDENGASPLTNLVTLPQFLLSGVFFPTDVFPSWVRVIADVLPLTFFNSAMRQLATEGAGLGELWLPILGLCVWGVLAYAIAARTFRWVPTS